MSTEKIDSDTPRCLDIVSPYTHLAGHYWPYTMDLLQALTAHYPELNITIHASREAPDFAISDPSTKLKWKLGSQLLDQLVPATYRNRHWDGPLDKALRYLEFKQCLDSAITRVRQSKHHSHIHCIESRHRVLCRAVIRTGMQFSTLCVGPPADPVPHSLLSLYRDAFQTGRLTFIVETEFIRSAWERIAGHNVVHIPAAVPHGMDSSLGMKDARRRLSLPENRTIMLFFGTHREGKDYDTAILAAKLSKSHPFLLFAGPLISNNDPCQLLKKHAYDHGASWEGYYPDSDLTTLFAACNAIVLPYNSGYEKGSGVLLQACQYLKPVIATNTGLFRKFIDEYDVGLVYESGSSSSLAEQYDKVAQMSHEDNSVLIRNLKNTRNAFSWTKLVGAYESVFFNSCYEAQFE